MRCVHILNECNISSIHTFNIINHLAYPSGFSWPYERMCENVQYKCPQTDIKSLDHPHREGGPARLLNLLMFIWKCKKAVRSLLGCVWSTQQVQVYLKNINDKHKSQRRLFQQTFYNPLSTFSYKMYTHTHSLWMYICVIILTLLFILALRCAFLLNCVW